MYSMNCDLVFHLEYFTSWYGKQTPNQPNGDKGKETSGRRREILFRGCREEGSVWIKIKAKGRQEVT